MPCHNDIKSYISEYLDKFYNKDKYKIIPNEILNSNNKTKEWFLSGYYLADGYKCYNQQSQNIFLTNKGKIGTSMLYYLVSSLV